MSDQLCPHCGATLGRKKLANLRASTPSVCPSCDDLICNSWRGELLGWLTYLLTAASVIMLARSLSRGYWLLVMIPFVAISPLVGSWAFAAWAEPGKNTESSPHP